MWRNIFTGTLLQQIRGWIGWSGVAEGIMIGATSRNCVYILQRDADGNRTGSETGQYFTPSDLDTWIQYREFEKYALEKAAIEQQMAYR